MGEHVNLKAGKDADKVKVKRGRGGKMAGTWG